MCSQILALRLLQAVLPSWDKTESSHDMKFLVEKLFNFLGSLLSTCSSDLPLLRGMLTNHTQAEWKCGVCFWKLFKWLSLHRRFLTKEEVPPSGVSYSHSQQHAGWGDCFCPAHSALSCPVEQHDKRLHQHSAELHWRCYGRLPVWSSKNNCSFMQYSIIVSVCVCFHWEVLT